MNKTHVVCQMARAQRAALKQPIVQYWKKLFGTNNKAKAQFHQPTL